jgi:hypothetical protein
MSRIKQYDCPSNLTYEAGNRIELADYRSNLAQKQRMD